jgi:molybdopterin synthase catalytic subunit
MAVEQMEAVRHRAVEKHDILDAAIVHRLGRLELGVTSIVIAVVAAHRGPAFEACRWILDQVKTNVPIWKKDIWTDGSQTWVDPTHA